MRSARPRHMLPQTASSTPFMVAEGDLTSNATSHLRHLRAANLSPKTVDASTAEQQTPQKVARGWRYHPVDGPKSGSWTSSPAALIAASAISTSAPGRDAPLMPIAPSSSGTPPGEGTRVRKPRLLIASKN